VIYFEKNKLVQTTSAWQNHQNAYLP